MFGIISYGHYVPMWRLAIGELAAQWGVPRSLERIYRLNGRQTLAVPATDEDTVTIAIEAAERALAAGSSLASPGSVIVGSESHPYAVKPSGVIVAEALGLTPRVFVADVEFACKGGTAAFVLSAGLVHAGTVQSALAIGADCPQSAPGSLLEASVGAAGAAFVLGRSELLASVDAVESVSSDATDFWRRDTARFPAVVGKFSSVVGYTEHTTAAVTAILNATGTRPSDYQFVCLHQPYTSLPLAVGLKLGFSRAQLRAGLTSGRIGNSYSSACLLSLCAVLEIAQPGDRILLTSYGSGAGSDGIALTVQPGIAEFRARAQACGSEATGLQTGDQHADFLTYGRYAHAQRKLHS